MMWPSCARSPLVTCWNGHLEILGKIAIVFSDSDEVDKLLAARSADELDQLLQAVNQD